MFDLLERLKTGIKEIVGSRAFITAVVFCLLSAVLVQRVFYLQIVKGQDYADRYEIQIQKTKVPGEIFLIVTAGSSPLMSLHIPLQLKTTASMTARKKKTRC